ncbi:hypothetical protein PU630_16175 [Microbacterium horticulturae]|uniref:Uncharacterized protein n=1 Tax=Microbacterium horticulturae TaxID=3028316 RepID=A0ABY8BXZ6_9MICO|nr:hypothetical protein [Microbacterium sp. KACC 23027]WEG08757.1 hypothetical protein PU630_16175 [Microbacterium sp. KACC 23027]
MDALDELLDASAAELPEPIAREAQRLATAVAPRRRVGRRWLVLGIGLGAVALTAGSGVAITMAHWGGVSMPLDNVRNEVPIPVAWTTDDGHTDSCRAWIELRNPHDGDGATLDAAIHAHDWDGLGQRLYDTTTAAPGSADDADGETRVGNGLGPVVRRFATGVFPGIGWFDAPAGERAVDAWGFRCDR